MRPLDQQLHHHHHHHHLHHHHHHHQRYYPSNEAVQHLPRQSWNNCIIIIIIIITVTTPLSAGPFTVLAPNDEAFQRLPKPVVEQLQRNKTVLTDLLLYHVLNGSVLSTQLKNEELVPSLFANHNLRFNIYNDGKVGSW